MGKRPHHSHAPPSVAGTSTRIGRPDDRCEVVYDARSGHDHDHAHDHDHGADTPSRAADRRRLLGALALTGVVFVVEVIGGLRSGSLALLSDAGHMLTDLSAQLLALLALVFATRPATPRRSFGYHRLEILAALANGVLLVPLAGYIAIHAWSRLGHPPSIDTGLMIGVACIGLVANLSAARLLHGAQSLNVRGAYLHLITDGLGSLAVIIGGVVMHVRHGAWIIDPLLGFAIAGFVIFGAWLLLREAIDVLLEAVPPTIDLERVRDEVRGIAGIEDVHDLHIWSITSGMFALSAHLVVRHDQPASDNDRLLRTVKELLHRNHRISHSTLQIESTRYEHVAHVHG